ncbi:phosphopantetheine-binding protein [Spirillospora sp. CA-255316]
MTTSTGLKAVRDWILSRHPELDDLEDETDLFESGLISSLDTIQLVVTIERASGQRIDRRRIEPGDLRSLSSIEAKFFGDDGGR